MGRPHFGCEAPCRCRSVFPQLQASPGFWRLVRRTTYERSACQYSIKEGLDGAFPREFWGVRNFFWLLTNPFVIMPRFIQTSQKGLGVTFGVLCQIRAKNTMVLHP